MARSKHIGLVEIGLILVLFWGGWGGGGGVVEGAICPLGDLDGNCKVDLVDVQILTGFWLDPGCTAPGCEADLAAGGGVDLIDYAWLAVNHEKTGVHVVISEFMAKNEGSFLTKLNGQWEPFLDWIELYNPSDVTVDLGGCYLVDHNNQWPFPPRTILPGNSCLVVFASGQDDADYPVVDDLGYLHTNFKLDKDGEYVALVLPNGETVEHAYPDAYPQYNDWSYGLSLDLLSEGYFYPATPGKPNTTSEPVSDPTRNVVISEIMYHPYHDSENTQPEPTSREFIEIYNRGIEPVDLTDWRFSDGVGFTFPAKTLDPNQYLVVAANVSIFLSVYPQVDPNRVVGGWTGRLSNSGEDIDLDDENGLRMDSVHYFDQGDWSRRELGPLDYYHRGWQWKDDHDGGGKSLELIHPRISNNYGQNWAASIDAGGTPGRPNTVAENNLAPMILEVTHKPILPKNNEPVQVTARIRDESTANCIVKLHYREDESEYLGKPVFPHYDSNAYTIITMHDDGLNGDWDAGDGTYTGEIPSYAAGTILEFFVEADDGVRARTWPAPVDVDGEWEQVVNCLYQVYQTDPVFDPDDEWAPGSQPLYHIIMTREERGRLQDIHNGSSDRYSNAQMNGTFISVDGVDTKCRYTTGVRNRGHGSRDNPPNNFRVNFKNDESWKEVTAINLNSQYTYRQYSGHTLFALAGLPSEYPLAVQLRINGINHAADYNNLTQDSYVHLEAYDTEWAANHFPDDSDGNIYGAVSYTHSADLDFLSWDPNAYNKPKDKYDKKSNSALHDWWDLIQMTHVLDVDETAEPEWLGQVEQVIHRDQWLRWFALNNLMTNVETNLSNGVGDDYYLYFGSDDPRCILLPHDLDSVFIDSSTSSIWLDGKISYLPEIRRFLQHPQYAGAYYAQFRDLFATVFAQENFDAEIDRLLYWVNPSVRTSIKNFIVSRRSNILTGADPQIPQNAFTLQTTFIEDPPGSGYYKTTGGLLNGEELSGTAEVYETRSVFINGVESAWDHLNGDWGIDTAIPLHPGINRIMIQTFDELAGNGSILEQDHIDIWYDDGDRSTVPNPLTEPNTVLDAGSGPWYLASNLTVPAGKILNIQPGTTVYFNQDVRLTVQGQLVAVGTEYERIRLTLDPDAGDSAWGGIFFDHTDEENRLCYVDMEHAESRSEKIEIDHARVFLDSVTWTFTSRNVLEVHNPKLLVQNCVFPDHDDEESIYGTGLTGDEFLIIRGNTFGWIEGYQDAIDFGGGDWPGPIIQIYDNVFLGGEDDGLDLDNADAHIEGNVFMNYLGGSGTGTSNCIAADQGSKLTVVRNLFYNNQSGILIKGGAELVAADHNTFVNHSLSAVDFVESGSSPGYGATMAGNIFWNNTADFLDADQVTTLILDRSIVSAAWHSYGVENIDANPHFVNDQDDFRLRWFSPALGTGPLGLDIGAYVPEGAALKLTTLANSATIIVGGPGITDYQYSLDDPNGPWSAETPVSQPIQLNGLSNGQTYTLYAVGKHYAGDWQDSADAASITWTVSNNGVPLVLNEVLAINDTGVEHNGQYPDMIELYYAGAAPIFLDNMTISDDPGDPLKYRIPNGTILDSTNRYLVLYADPNTVQPYHTGFALDGDGEAIYLYDSTGHLLDSVEFGTQIPDLSIGRVNQGPWRLTVPTMGQANQVQDVGVPETLKINEWLADGKVLFADDFVELCNPDPLPVDLSHMFLSDNPITQPYKHSLGALSYIAGEGYKAFVVDNSNNPGHVNFQLNASKELISLLDPERNKIDQVFYGPQTTDISQGRSPDGSDVLGFFVLPTPNLPNITADTEPTTLDLILTGAEVKYAVPLDSTWESTWMNPTFTDLQSWTSDTTALGFGEVFGPNGSGRTAYNDCKRGTGDSTAANVTSFTLYSGSESYPSSGPLEDYDTGSTEGMPTVTFTASAGNLINSASSDNPVLTLGTDLYDVFGGIVDFSTGGSISYGSLTGWWIDIEFSNLIPSYQYSFAGTTIRNTSSDYSNRVSRFTIRGHESATNASTEGSGIWREGDVTRMLAWNNDETGNVVRWDDIHSGSDGVFTIRAECNGDTGAGEDPRRAYPLHAFRLQEIGSGENPLEQAMVGTNATLWTRIEFDLEVDPDTLTSLTMKVRYEDGLVAYLNGAEVVRSNFTGAPAWNSQADSDRDNSLADTFETFDLIGHIGKLQQGNNVLAIHALNENAADPNFLILPELTAISDPNTDDNDYPNALALLKGLRITEMMYHPQDEPVSHPDAEFIELQNVGPEPLELGGVRFIEGITFTFPSMTLGAGEYVVLVKDPTIFQNEYGVIPEVLGQYSGSLSNGGEDIILQLPVPFEAAIMRFEYKDTWYPTTDGGGYALVKPDPLGPAATWDDRDYWSAGSVLGGSPGTADP